MFYLTPLAPMQGVIFVESLEYATFLSKMGEVGLHNGNRACQVGGHHGQMKPLFFLSYMIS